MRELVGKTQVGGDGKVEQGLESCRSAKATRCFGRRCSEAAPLPSHLARFLEAQGESPGDDTEALEAVMAGSIDSVLRSQHMVSERWRPEPSRVAAVLPRGLRAQLVAWILQTFDVLGLDDALVHGIALTVDRFCASQDCALPQSSLECLLLSAACTEFKTDGFSEMPDGTWKRILVHMSQ
ncbi:unnamed protein product, partial [Polarella glacialis]